MWVLQSGRDGIPDVPIGKTERSIYWHGQGVRMCAEAEVPDRMLPQSGLKPLVTGTESRGPVNPRRRDQAPLRRWTEPPQAA
jgi:hypothetical protein